MSWLGCSVQFDGGGEARGQSCNHSIKKKDYIRKKKIDTRESFSSVGVGAAACEEMFRKGRMMMHLSPDLDSPLFSGLGNLGSSQRGLGSMQMHEMGEGVKCIPKLWDCGVGVYTYPYS